ncbi:tryptophan biosynthesis modulator TrpM [Streptomyces sp. NRRL F-5630]|uniref:tryptophan biosynthesis modulator TrpM n=1 Tax=Streptomyces sp. NRRL F-5630 TaxID=1463864 RepID=UPI003EBDF179
MTTASPAPATRQAPCPSGVAVCAAESGPAAPPRPGLAPERAACAQARDPYACLARGCRPRGCRAPARRVHGRRVRYVIGDEPGQVNGMRWRRAGR